MDEEGFRALYARTARPLWGYLARVSGDRALADDLLQETYCRFLASRPKEMSDEHRRNYLFRIALNLVRDHWRRSQGAIDRAAETEKVEKSRASRAGSAAGEEVERGPELRSALRQVKPRERELLWLAYVEGFSHKEIAELTGVKAASLRPMLFRARHKLAQLLRPDLSGRGANVSVTASGQGR